MFKLASLKKSKVHKAFTDKPKRTKEEIDKEYTTEAIWVGHKARMIANLEADVAKLQGEVDQHLKRLVELNEEGMRLGPQIQTGKSDEVLPEQAKKEETK